MEEIKKIYKIFLFIILSFLFNNFTSANIYQTNCKTVEKKNNIKSLSFVFSFERKSIVINKINNNKIKYKINISKVVDKNNFIFNAEDKYFRLEHKPSFSYIKKNNSNPKFNLVNNELSGININCSTPKLIKSEVVAAELPKNENITEINEDQIKEILEKLQSGKGVDKGNLNEIISSLQENNNQSNIDLGQLQGLLQSQSFLGQLAKGDLFDKLSSEEFLKMIVDEFNKLTKSRNTN